MAKPLSSALRARAEPIWRAQHEHPFVRGIGDGTLDLEKFKHWVRQDYLFLIEYCRLFGLAAARAPDLETLTRFAALLAATARTEMDLHRAYAREFGISDAELEREPMADPAVLLQEMDPGRCRLAVPERPRARGKRDTNV